MAPSAASFLQRSSPAGSVLACLLLPAMMLGHVAAQTYTYTVQSGTDYAYNDIHPSDGPTNAGVCGSTAYSESAAACETRCNNAAACAGYVHYADTMCCYIKSKLENPTTNARTISHLKTGYPGYTVAYGVDYPYNDIPPPAGAPTDIGVCGNSATSESVSACVARCDSTGPACVGVAHFADNNCCYRKSAQATKTVNARVATYTKIVPTAAPTPTPTPSATSTPPGAIIGWLMRDNGCGDGGFIDGTVSDKFQKTCAVINGVKTVKNIQYCVGLPPIGGVTPAPVANRRKLLVFLNLGSCTDLSTACARYNTTSCPLDCQAAFSYLYDPTRAINSATLRSTQNYKPPNWPADTRCAKFMANYFLG